MSHPVADRGAVRVLWLIKGLGPGGAENLLVNQARVRDREAVEVAAAYLLPWKAHLVPKLAEQEVTAVCLEGGSEADLRWAWRLRKLIVDHRPEVIHVHSPYVAVVTRLMLRTIPRSRRPALVATEHNRWPRHRRVIRTANRLTIGLDDADLAVSEDVRSTMGPSRRDRVEAIRHGIDTEAVREALGRRSSVRERMDVAHDELLVVTVANLRREKGLDVLLEAAAIVTVDPRGKRVRFVHVGQGPLADELAAQHERLGLGDSFVLAGYDPNAVEVVAAGDVFCMASRHEGLPVSMMEALALGRPVVATRVGGIPELVTDGVEAVLVPPDDAAALAEALMAVADDDHRRAGMAAAALIAGESVGIEPAQRRLEEIYRELADQRSARSAATSESISSR